MPCQVFPAEQPELGRLLVDDPQVRVDGRLRDRACRRCSRAIPGTDLPVSRPDSASTSVQMIFPSRLRDTHSVVADAHPALQPVSVSTNSRIDHLRRSISSTTAPLFSNATNARCRPSGDIERVIAGRFAMLRHPSLIATHDARSRHFVPHVEQHLAIRRTDRIDIPRTRRRSSRSACRPGRLVRRPCDRPLLLLDDEVRATARDRQHALVCRPAAHATIRSPHDHTSIADVMLTNTDPSASEHWISNDLTGNTTKPTSLLVRHVQLGELCAAPRS